VDPDKEAGLNKAPDAFRTISEVADELDLPQHVLRFWESRFPHIKPMKRGGGRRYYRPDDVDLLRGIRHLLYGDGYTIRGVQRILREQGVRIVQSVGQGHAVTLAAPPRGKTGDAEPADARGALDFLPPMFSGVSNRSEPGIERAPQAEEGPAAPEAAPQRRPKGEAKTTQAATALAPAKASAAETPLARMAPEDLDRLKAALAALEACSRLLDKAGGP
jgi:DNA-binding transcriptional MerR regulator